MADSDFAVHALVGAVVTVLLSFTFFSPLLGGALAGYLHGNDGAKVGALSGIVAVIPLFALAFLLGAVFAFVPFVGPINPVSSESGVFVLVLFVFVLVVLTAFVVGLSALGGYVGEYLSQEDVF